MKSLRQLGITVPFVVLANESDESVAIDLVCWGAGDYIFKDRPRQLPIAIRQAIGKHSIEKIVQNTLKDLSISKSRFRSLIENSSDAVVILNADGKPTYVSPSASKVLGYSPKDNHADGFDFDRAQ